MLLLPGFFGMQAEAGYNLKLTGTKLPKDVTTENTTGSTPISSDYYCGWTASGWTSDRFGDRGYVLLCPTRVAEGEEVSSMITLPEIAVYDGWYLRWDDRAVLPGFSESLYVELIHGAGKEITTLYADSDVNHRWESHAVDLSEYAGEEIAVRFVCSSANGYMLAVDNVSIDIPENISFDIVNNTPHYLDTTYANNGDNSGVNYHFVAISAYNCGRTLGDGELVCRVGDEIVASQHISSLWHTGEERDIVFTVPAPYDVRVDYRIEYLPASGESVEMISDWFCTSAFRRRLLVDKGSGMWCNNCPKGIIAVENLEQQFGDEILALDTHVRDLVANDGYFAHLGFNDIPKLMLNRMPSTSTSDVTAWNDKYPVTTHFNIWIENLESAPDNAFKVRVKYCAAEDLDNADDRIRVAYVLSADMSGADHGDFYQANNCHQPAYRQYYYLPTNISASLVRLNNVTITSEDAFCGIAGSVPQSMDAYIASSYEWSVKCPDLIEDLSSVMVTVMLLDTESGEVLNAARSSLAAMTGVNNPEDDHTLHQMPAGIWNMQGMRVADSVSQLPLLPSGLYIVDGKKIIK